MINISLFKKSLYIFLVVSTFLFTSVSNSKEPINFIKEVTAEASGILATNISKDAKILKLRELAEKTVDIKGVGYYSLGKHRKKISKNELIEYEKLFTEYFLKSFSSRLAEYSDPKIRVDSQEKLNEKYTMVSSTLLAGDDKPEVKIGWRIVTKDPNNPLIIDVVIEGVSLAKVQKEEFNSIIQSNGGDIKVLFTTLQEFINQ